MRTGAFPKPSASFTPSELQERDAGRLVEPYASASSGPGCRNIRVQSPRAVASEPTESSGKGAGEVGRTAPRLQEAV